MAKAPIPEAAVQAMDDTAAWAVSHMPALQPANRADDATIQQRYDVLQQSLAHFRRAGRVPAADPDYGAFFGQPGDPRTPDDDDEAITPEQAQDQAAAEWLSTPAKVAAWLMKHCDTPAGRKPVEGIDALHADEVMELPIVGLLAVLMTGTDEQALIARRMLRDDALEINHTEIGKRAAELLAVVQ